MRWWSLCVCVVMLFARPAMAQRTDATDLRLRVTVHSWEKGDDSTRFTITATDTASGALPMSTA